MQLSKRLRYEVLRRDGFKCRYCGRGAPEVKLTVDHVTPVALGGTDEATNLVAACLECNAGKSSASADNEFVQELDEQAQRWRSAMQAAAQIRHRERDQLERDLDALDLAWRDWYLEREKDLPPDKRAPIPRPLNWRSTAETFLIRGLEVDEMQRLIKVAMTADLRLEVENAAWRYFVGCCKRTVADLEKVARDLIATQERAGAPTPSAADVPDREAVGDEDTDEFREPKLTDL